MYSKKLKPKKTSIIEISKKFANDPVACLNFFIHIKWPTGFYCDKCNHHAYYSVTRHNVLECTMCGHQHYIFSGTIFQDNKLELYKLILGIFLFFTANKGYSAIEMASALDVNYKTALRLCKKCRILMALSNSNIVLDSMFYESDVTYLGASSEEKAGMATDKQPVLTILSTDQENNYPKKIKLCLIPTDNQDYLETFITKRVSLSKEKKLNTDGKTTFLSLKKK